MLVIIDGVRYVSPVEKSRVNDFYTFIIGGDAVTITLRGLVDELAKGKKARLAVMATTKKGGSEVYVIVHSVRPSVESNSWGGDGDKLYTVRGSAVPVYHHTGPVKHRTIIIEFGPEHAPLLAPALDYAAVSFTATSAGLVVTNAA